MIIQFHEGSAYFDEVADLFQHLGLVQHPWARLGLLSLLLFRLFLESGVEDDVQVGLVVVGGDFFRSEAD